MTTSKEWADRTFERATYWNTHDRCPNDYGPPERPYESPYPPGDELDTIAEWERMKMEDVTNDLLITY